MDAFNSRLVAERKGWSLDTILAEMEDTQAALQELVGGLSDRDLFESGPFRGPYWENLAEWLLNNLGANTVEGVYLRLHKEFENA